MVDTRFNVLIVDTTIALAEQTASYLDKGRFNVLGIATRHEDTLIHLQTLSIDLVLTDIDINGKIDGIESCNIIYQKFHIPSILVSSIYNEEILFMVENSYAYGYILKPIHQELLKITLLLILKKLSNNPQTKSTLSVLNNHFKFCMEKRALYRNNVEVTLTKNEKTLLYILVKYKNSNVPYETLFRHIWKDQEFSINKIRGAIFRLRIKYPDLLITNNYEMGYKIEG